MKNYQKKIICVKILLVIKMKLWNKIKDNKLYFYFLAFIIPVIIMTIIYAFRGIYPFGDNSLLTVDMAGQYVAFFNALKNIFSGTANIFYSFSKTLGGNMFGLVAYYLLSPLNLLIAAFPKESILEVIFLITVLKIGLCGLSSYTYFRNTFKDKSGIALLFSFVYAFMAYNIVYSQNIMWIDGVILLPLIFMAIDRLITKQKPVAFCLLLALSIVINYYMGYMLCIASLVYFIYKLYLHNNYKFSYKDNKKDFLYFFKYALLAVGISGVILLPSIFSLLAGKTDGGLSKMVPRQSFAILDVFSRFFIGTFKQSDLLGVYPHIFVSLIILILIIVYFFNKKIEKKEKLASAILLLFIFLSFTLDIFNIVWHLFSHPIGFPFRNAYIFVLFFLIIAYNSYLKIKYVDTDIFKKMIPIVFAMCLIMDKLMFSSNMYYKIIGSGVIIIIYLLYFYKSKERKIGKAITLLIAFEMILNTSMIVYNINYQKRVQYTDFIDKYGTVIDTINKNDDDFYRIEKDYSYTTNDPLLLNYNGLSHFSSTYEGVNNKLLGDYLGIFNRFYVTNYQGSTLVTNSLFNIKYLLSEEDNLYYDLIGKEDTLSVYQNKYNLPLGFLVNKELENLSLIKYEPFINQNNILKAMTGIDKNVFYEQTISDIKTINLKDDYEKNYYSYTKGNGYYDASIIYSVRVEKEGQLYFYLGSKYEKKVNILLNGESIIDVGDENGYMYNVLDLGYYKQGDLVEVEVQLLENNLKFNNVMFYTFDLDNFSEHINVLKDNEHMDIVCNSGHNIKATINNELDTILYTSIPLDKGWTIKVDGKVTEPIEIFNTLIGIQLESGTHTIELEYVPRGLYLGGFISVISICLLLALKKGK